MSINCNWTEGPWAIQNGGDIFGPLGGDSGDGVAADHDDGWQVAEVGFYQTFVDGELMDVGGAVRKANMCLIAAAPELYEALCTMVNNIEAEHHWYPADIQAAKAALAKARGES